MAKTESLSPFSAKSALPKQYDIYPFIDPPRFANKLKGKVVLITGASAGIGKESTHAFADAGASVACIARRKPELDALVREVKSKYGVSALAVDADISDSSKAKSVIEQVEQGLGPVDVLLNCAGITRYGTLAAEEDFETWWRVLDINLRGPAALIHAVLPSMISRKTGVVMSVASTSGSQDVPYGTSYATSKAAVIKLHQDLAIELQKHNILSFSVHPGTVATELGQLGSAINMQSVAEEPHMQAMLKNFEGVHFQTTKLAAWTFVALVADDRCRALAGKYVDAEQDLGEVVQEAEKEGGGRIGRERLYHLKLDEL